MSLPNEKTESVLVHQNEYDTYAVANRMARRLIENDKYLESLLDAVEASVSTDSITNVSGTSYMSVTVPHSSARRVMNVTVVDASYGTVPVVKVQYMGLNSNGVYEAVVTFNQSSRPSPAQTWLFRFS